MTNAEREASAEVLKAIAHPIRLGVIELLAERELTVSELHHALDCSQSSMSLQLNILRNKGLVSMRRDKQTKYCSLRNRDFLPLFVCLKKHIHNILKIEENPEVK